MRNHRVSSALSAILLSLLLVASAACAIQRPGEVLVKYKPGMRAQVQSSADAIGGVVTQNIDQIRTRVLKLPQGLSVEDALQRLQGDPNIEYAGPNHIVSICLEPNDEYFLDSWFYYYWQWGLYSDLYPDAGIDAPYAWDITTGSSSVVIANVDTGVDLGHEDLYAKIVQGRNVITGASDPTDPQDDHGHGTFTAGVAAAMTDNSIGVAGVSWGAMIMPIKALDSDGYGTEADAAAGVIWAADHGARIINMSFGGYDDVPVERDAIAYAWNKGCVLAGASGNDGTSQLFYPACYEQVIAVGASNESMERCSAADWGEGGSNYGDYLDVMAPGNGIMSTYWDTLGGTYNIASGTSAAAPFVSGIAAVIWGEHPTWTNLQVVNQIKTTCKDIGDAGWDQYTGWGLVSAYYALVNPPVEAATLGGTNAMANGVFAMISDGVITSGSADLPDRLCIEDQMRGCALSLPFTNVPSGYIEGDVVQAMGMLSRVDGERAIQGASLSKTSHRDPLGPLGMPNRWIGGASQGQRTGVDGGLGLNNLSMLVAAYGRVTAVGWTYFYVDDGSSLFDGSGIGGLKVISRSLSKPARGSYVRVTGMSSCEQPPGAGVTIPVVRLRRQSDITTLY
jgi:hypothetical protein